MTLLTSNMVIFAGLPLNLISCFNAVEASGGTWKGRELRLEVTFAALGLANLIFCLRIVVKHAKFVLIGPQAVAHACLTRLTEIFLGLEQISWVLSLFMVIHLRGPNCI